MEICLIKEKKLVEIWLTRAEGRDEALRESLKPLYARYGEKKYKTAVFLSGTRNLAESSSELLCYNRRRIAELQVQKEKEQTADI